MAETPGTPKQEIKLFYCYAHEETMNGPGVDCKGNPSRSDDADFFAGAIRGLDEKFAIPTSTVESVKVLSLNIEYLTLSVDVITIIKLSLTAEKIRQGWLLKAWRG